jgi:predicted ATP-dependent endonuclease of OLD family
MKLQAVQVTRFRNFDDSDEVAIEDDITTLIGENESGKTPSCRRSTC